MADTYFSRQILFRAIRKIPVAVRSRSFFCWRLYSVGLRKVKVGSFGKPSRLWGINYPLKMIFIEQIPSHDDKPKQKNHF